MPRNPVKEEGVSKMNDEIKLDNCPFCSGEAMAIIASPTWMVKKYRGRYAAVGCTECGAQTSFFDADNHTGSPILNEINEKAAIKKAAEAWNRRAQHG